MFKPPSNDGAPGVQGQAEKSKKVHLVNWKADVMLEKRIQSLNKEEKDVVSYIAIDQRIVTTKFKNNLRRSAKIAQSHQGTLQKLDVRRYQFEQGITTKEHLKDARNMFGKHEGEGAKIKAMSGYRSTARTSPLLSTSSINGTDFDFVTTLPENSRTGKRDVMCKQSLKTPIARDQTTDGVKPYSMNRDKGNVHEFLTRDFRRENCVIERSKSALQNREKIWQRRVAGANQTVERVKSAPVKSWRNMADIMNILNSKTGAFYVKNKLHRPISRERFMETFDYGQFRTFRERETEQEAQKVKKFVETLKPLRLIPWTPWHENSSKDSKADSAQLG